MKATRRQTRGYTLIELIIALVAFGVMAAALVPVAINSLRAYDVTRHQSAAMDGLRYAVERLAREVREAQYLPASSAYDILTMQAQQIRFRRPFVQSAGGVLVRAVDDVTISLSGDRLLLNYVSLGLPVAPVLLDRVSSFSLEYLDAEGVAGAGVGSVVAVRIALSVQDAAGRIHTHRTTVELRNREVL